MKKISILVPVYNEEKNIKIFYDRLKKILLTLQNYEYEILFTDNCSIDNTVKEINKLIEIDNKVRLITFSRNFGRNISQMASLRNANGDIIFMIDVDCEDPPEMLTKFIQKYEEGFDLVYGIRNRIKESIILYFGAKIFYRVTKFFADRDFILDMAEFSLFDKSIKDSIINISTDKPFIRAELSASGFKRTGIKYKREKRRVGKSNYNFSKLIKYAIAGFLSSSTVLLRMIAYLGFLFATINIFTFLIYDNHLKENLFEKIILFNITYLILAAIIIALYISRIHNNTLDRPLYIIDKKKSKNNNKLV